LWLIEVNKIFVIVELMDSLLMWFYFFFLKVEQRYRQYQQQMEIVVLSFDVWTSKKIALEGKWKVRGSNMLTIIFGNSEHFLSSLHNCLWEYQHAKPKEVCFTIEGSSVVAHCYHSLFLSPSQFLLSPLLLCGGVVNNCSVKKEGILL